MNSFPQSFDECTPEFFDELEKRLASLPFYGRKCEHPGKSALDVFKMYEGRFKIGRSLKHGALYGMNGLCRAVVYAMSTPHEQLARNSIYWLVQYRAPKLNQAAKDALQIVADEATVDGRLSRLFHDPATEQELRDIANMALSRAARQDDSDVRQKLCKAADTIEHALDGVFESDEEEVRQETPAKRKRSE